MATYSVWSFRPARFILTSQEDEGNAASQPVSHRPVAARASRLGESGAPVYVGIFSGGASAHDPVGVGGARHDEIAAALSIGRDVVSLWRKRFFEQRLGG